MEIWKQFRDFNYEVSTDGRVRRLDTKKIISQCKMKNGYLQARLWKNNKEHHFYIHRMVAECFIPNPENKSDVDHIDRCRYNNRVNNLRWLTHRENKDDESNRGLIKYPKKPCKCIELNMEFDSCWAAALYINLTYFNNKKNQNTLSRMIAEVCSGKRHKTCGFHFSSI